MAFDMSWAFGGGCLVSIVDDLHHWFCTLGQGEVISAENCQSMTSPHTPNNGTSTGYGYGLGITQFNQHDVCQHSGNIPGFAASAMYFPTEEFTIVALSNNDAANMYAVCTQLARQAL